jgi:translation initiation factor 2 subunit 1
MNLEVGDLVQCTVERIERTVVFVRIDGNGEGSIVTSEIAPGRIRNIRNYVVPKKRIVCKVLRISQGGNVELSFRRVTPKEKKEVMEQFKQEKSYMSVIKSILGENSEKAIKKITEQETLFEFFEDAKENPKKLEEVFNKEGSEKILEILNSQKEKKAIVKKEISLKITAPNGLELIKEILGDVKDIDIKYVSAGKYSLKTESENKKNADKKLKELIDNIEKNAKKIGAEFSIIEK